jgi:endonuclease VIII-like 1
MITLKPVQVNNKSVFILCNMGMTGFFEAASTRKDKHKHAHLSFNATDGTVLSFVDVRRFGTWRCLDGPDWPADRGPDPVSEHAAFRLGVVSAVCSKPHLFASKPICQVLHDQSIFNGIGNYLRAEVLFRAGVPPFTPAKDVLMKLPEVAAPGSAPDILTLCRDVPKEVIDMHLSKYQGGPAANATDTTGEHERWEKWLRVYSHDDASWAVDQEGRRIWFHGPPGKLHAKFSKKSHLVKAKKSGSVSLSSKSNAAKRDAKFWFAGTPAAMKKRPRARRKSSSKKEAASTKPRIVARKRPAASDAHKPRSQKRRKS